MRHKASSLSASQSTLGVSVRCMVGTAAASDAYLRRIDKVPTGHGNPNIHRILWLPHDA